MFLSPAFLIGGAIAAAAPLLLHLLQRRRQASIAFPTLRFLKLAEQQSSRRMRLENLLLWLLRTLIMASLGFAFAMPVIRARGLAWLGQAPRDVAIIVDASYSMGYQVGRETVWDQALEAATSIINGLGDKDRYCLYLARDQPEPLIAEPVSTRDLGVQLLTAATLKSTGSRLAPSIQAARAVLDREQKGREQEIYVLTDGQAMAWARGDRSPGGDPAEAAVEHLTPFVALLGVPAPVNLSPASLTMNPPLVVRNAPARIQLRTLYTGPDRESIARLFIDDQEIGRRPLRLEAGDAGEVEFVMPPRAAGVYSARVETPDDALQIDNAFHFLVRVRDRLPVLSVGTEEDTLYLRTALRAALTGGPGVEPSRVDPAAVSDEPLRELAAVFLCNALPLSGQALSHLEQYVRSGGLLVIFPGERAVPEDYQPWTSLPGAGTSVVDLSVIERSRTLSWPSADHPLLGSFPRGMTPPRVSIRRSLAWQGLAENARSLISQGPDAPFLLERSVGEGRVLMFAVPADRTWSDFPLSPFFLPLLAQVVEYSSGVGILAPSIWAADSMPLSKVIPGATRDTTLLDPDAHRLPVSSAVVNGITQLRVEGLTTPGIYEADGKGPALAVNMKREESDLSPIAESHIKDLFEGDIVHVARDPDTLQQLIQEHRTGRTYGEHLLWIVLALVGVEFVYANRLARSGPARSKHLAVEASGRLTGHPEATS